MGKENESTWKKIGKEAGLFMLGCSLLSLTVGFFAKRDKKKVEEQHKEKMLNIGEELKSYLELENDLKKVLNQLTLKLTLDKSGLEKYENLKNILKSDKSFYKQECQKLRHLIGKIERKLNVQGTSTAKYGFFSQTGNINNEKLTNNNFNEDYTSNTKVSF